MKKYFISLACLFSCVAVHASLIAESTLFNQNIARVRYMPEKPTMKVLLHKNKDALQVEVQGCHNVYDPYSGAKLESAFTGSSYYMKPTTDGIKWGQNFLGTFQLLIVPDGTTSSGVSVNGVMYSGVVVFYQVDDRLAAVNWLSLEEFTSSMLSSALLPQADDQAEALAAYAIAVRSRAYEHMVVPECMYWDIQAEQCGYKGKSTIRSDGPFLQAMKASERVVFEQTIAGLNKNILTEIAKTMPYDEVNKLAEKGKNARYILEKFYPKTRLVFLEQSK